MTDLSTDRGGDDVNENGAPETVSEVCDSAADLIEERGWMQGSFWAHHADGKAYNGGPVCLVGGVSVATGKEDEVLTPHGYIGVFSHPALVAVGEFLDWDDRVRIHHWNDNHRRTASEVVQALRDTATKHRPDEMTSS